MNEHNTCDLLLDYFNDCLNEIDKTKFKEHLASCNECQVELEELQMLTEDLPLSSEPIEPNDGMKNRILSSVFAQPIDNEINEQTPEYLQTSEVSKPNESNVRSIGTMRRNKGLIQSLLAASLLLSLSANAYFYLNDEGPNEGAIDTVEEEGTDEVVNRVELAATEGFSGTAQAAMIQKESGMALVVQASDLNQLTGSEAYQVWLIDKSGSKFRAGTFLPNENGEGAVSFPIDYKGEHDWDTIAVTLEPTPTSEQPQGDIILASKL
ncbi:anti-sigma factor [Pseudalkalibacillus decolorationis]|uniref:anti-sigma factor n=1 Tax=Pseudalkalibacillus decolorationis TaxID=163879 RepID=UPI0021491571|nr:anti-sigma factor [Pseudalkalibacillus decolorationis]